MLLIHVGPPELSVIRNRGVPLFRGSFYTLLYGLLAGTAANVCYREVSAIQGSVIEGFQCTCILMVKILVRKVSLLHCFMTVINLILQGVASKLSYS